MGSDIRRAAAGHCGEKLWLPQLQHHAGAQGMQRHQVCINERERGLVHTYKGVVRCSDKVDERRQQKQAIVYR